MYAIGASAVKSLMKPIRIYLGRRGPLPALLAALSLLLFSAPAAAQEPVTAPPEIPGGGSVMPGIDEFAITLAELTTRRWGGQRTPHPDPSPRPRATWEVSSATHALKVHGDDPARAARTLTYLEDFAAWLSAANWPRPFADGGRGGDDAFDLYLVPEGRLASSGSDGRLNYSFLDAVTSFARVDPASDDLESCVAQAYADALLLQQDPAEHANWRRATAAWLAWRFTGRWCTAGVTSQQSEPERGWIAHGADEGAGGALLMAMLSERFDGGDTSFVRELWQLARQRTWDGDALRGSPDLWEGLNAIVDHAGGRLSDLVEELAVARYALGARSEHSVFPALVLDDRATVPVFETIPLAELPEHGVDGPRLDPFGSAYAIVEVAGAPPGSRLRVWLRGEHGVAWSLTAMRLNALGNSLGRLSAPPRPGDRRSYLPVELTEDTTHVLVVETNLSHRVPDADTLDLNQRGFRLIYDLVED